MLSGAADIGMVLLSELMESAFDFCLSGLAVQSQDLVFTIGKTKECEDIHYIRQI